MNDYMKSNLKPELIQQSTEQCLYRAMSPIKNEYWQYVPVCEEYISWIPVRKVLKEISPELIYPITEDWKPYSKSYLNECFSSSEVAQLIELLAPLSNLKSLRVEKYMLPLDGDHMGVESCWLHNYTGYMVISLQGEFGKERIEQVFNSELHDVLGIIYIPQSLEGYNERMIEMRNPLKDSDATWASDEDVEDLPF